MFYSGGVKLDFHRLLREKGLKATPQRLLILNIIKEGGHIDIEEIYDKVKKIIPSISIATVYKNLKLLLDKGIIRDVNISSFKQMYEVNTKDHIHLVCKKCRNIYDLDFGEMDLKKFIEDNINNKIEKIEVNVFFECNNCKKSYAG